MSLMTLPNPIGPLVDWAPGGGTWSAVTPPYFFTGFTSTWPEIGFYKSQDEATIAWQLEQMQRAGINTVIISWSGWGDVNLDGTIDRDRIPYQVDKTTRMVLDHINDNDLPFRFSLLVEDFPNHEGFGGARNLKRPATSDGHRPPVGQLFWPGQRIR